MKEIVLDFRLRKGTESGPFRVQLTAENWKDEDDFAFEFDNARLKRVLAQIEHNQCSLDDLRDVGVNLWSGLTAGAVGELLETIRQGEPEDCRYQVRLDLPPELQPLPWEALYDDRNFGFLATHPHVVLLRAPPEAIAAPGPPPALDGPLRLLAVIPEGSGLSYETELHNLRLAIDKLGDRVHLEHLVGRVTPDRLAEVLAAGSWDVLHFVGHGEVPPSGRTKIRLNSEDAGAGEHWIDGEAFGNLLSGHPVRLALLNCCLGAKPSPQRSLSGVGPFLLRAGVPAVVAMRYEIPDSVAIKFADRFYHSLISGKEAGRVDLAVEHARQSVFHNQRDETARSFVTPILFLAGGCERLFEIEPAGAEKAAAPAPPAVGKGGAELPEDLVEAFRQGLCVPVVGHGLLTAAGMRNAPAIPGPGQIVRRLVDDFTYPRAQDLELCSLAGEWMELLLFQWVCQHLRVALAREFYKVTLTIQQAYGSAEPPPLLAAVARWPVPGLFYTYFDGLLEGAFEDAGRPVRVVNGVDAEVPPDTGSGTPLLVHVRGTHREPDSLVLTEQEHERLWDRIAEMTPEIAALFSGRVGRSLLFVGLSPRDPLTKRLTSQLLDKVSERDRGPVFFLCREGEAGEPFWEDLGVQWVEGHVDDQIAALSALAAGDGSDG